MCVIIVFWCDVGFWCYDDDGELFKICCDVVY